MTKKISITALLIMMTFMINAQQSNWKQYPISLNAVNKFHFIDANTGYAFGNKNECKLLATTNGGLSWILLFNLDTNQFGNLPSCIQFLPKNKIVVCKALKNGKLLTKISNDGGFNWNDKTSTDTLFAEPTQIFYKNDTLIINHTKPRRWYWIPPDQLQDGRYFNMVDILYSTDGGLTFKIIPTRSESIDFKYSKDLTRLYIYFIEQHGMIGTRETYCFYTDDLLQNIIESPYITNYGPGGNWRNYYLDSSSGYALGRSIIPKPFTSLYDSTSSIVGAVGADYQAWGQSNIPPIDAFVFDNLDVVILRGFIFYVKGISLKHEINPCSYALTCVAFGDYYVGYIGTDSSFYLKTTDGTTGISINASEDDRIDLFPNPAKNKLKINTKENSNKAKFYIYTLQGQLVLEGEFSDKETELDISQLKTGMYLFRTKNSVQKFIVLK